jgi:hypothetical protein
VSRSLAVISLLTAVHGGAEPYDPKKTQFPATALLPIGSELIGVQLPRYDENRQQIGLVKIALTKIISEDQVDAKTLSIEFFNPDRSPKASINLAAATFYRQRAMVVAKEPVVIKSELMTTHGSGLHYSLNGGKGFITGPVTTTLQLPEKKP